LDQVRYLKAQLDKILPSKDDSGWDWTWKALQSIKQNKDTQESMTELHQHVLLLAYYQATNAAESGQKDAAQQQLKNAAKKPVKVKPKLKQRTVNKPEALPEVIHSNPFGTSTINGFRYLPAFNGHLFMKHLKTDEALARGLLAQGADVNAIHSTGCTPLLTASRRKHDKIVSLLLDHGARINAVDNTQASSLCGAALWGNVSTVKLLLDRGARINPYNNVGRSALLEATTNRPDGKDAAK